MEFKQTPYLMLNVQTAIDNYKFIKDNINIKIFYAVKSNPDEHIVNAMNQLNSNFDVASAGEIRYLMNCGISPNRLIYANTVKTAEGLQLAKQYGIKHFTFDSMEEINKIAKYVPDAKLLLRIRVESNAKVNLNKKFGCQIADVDNLIHSANENGLNVVGIAFHVGSNCQDINVYKKALSTAICICKLHDLHILDIGGGFCHYETIKDTLHTIQQYTNEITSDYKLELWCEPGRFICENTMVLHTSVIGKTIRDGQIWYWLDEGIYGSLSNVICDHFIPEFVTNKTDNIAKSTFVGPSCDSIDIIREGVMMPELSIGDELLVYNMGAYKTVTATTFNGFRIAPVYQH